jgi:hypothetical protein
MEMWVDVGRGGDDVFGDSVVKNVGISLQKWMGGWW